ncbi:hypothetical protein [Halorubrum kocurii]|uniref:Uncharacterized protein n=1 Tax=Halorubrum kocurii JCM 14978 TaxID=1230456 RepID=M0NRS2_9EURY|nr:hypothetical protein [Halorubrum kocurii]EMA59919.1 hypothetical protein C468_14043 [Halorubrum kocurii JCM 14978]
MILDRLGRAVGAAVITYKEVIRGEDLAICRECGHDVDVSEVPLVRCPRCSGDLEEIDHYPLDTS